MNTVPSYGKSFTADFRPIVWPGTSHRIIESLRNSGIQNDRTRRYQTAFRLSSFNDEFDHKTIQSWAMCDLLLCLLDVYEMKIDENYGRSDEFHDLPLGEDGHKLEDHIIALHRFIFMNLGVEQLKSMEEYDTLVTSSGTMLKNQDMMLHCPPDNTIQWFKNSLAALTEYLTVHGEPKPQPPFNPDPSYLDGQSKSAAAIFNPFIRVKDSSCVKGEGEEEEDNFSMIVNATMTAGETAKLGPVITTITPSDMCDTLKNDWEILNVWQQAVTKSIEKIKDFMDVILNRLGGKRKRSVSMDQDKPPTKIRKIAKDGDSVGDGGIESSPSLRPSGGDSSSSDIFTTMKLMLAACKRRINDCQLMLEIKSHLEFLNQYFTCFHDSAVIVKDTNLVMDRTKLEIMIKTCLVRRGSPYSIMNELWFGDSSEVSNRKKSNSRNESSSSSSSSNINNNNNDSINNCRRSFEILERVIRLGSRWTFDRVVGYALDPGNLDKLCSLYKLKTVPSLTSKLDFNDWCMRCDELFVRDSLEVVKSRLPFLWADVSPDQEKRKKQLLSSRDKLQKMAAYWMTHEFCLPRTTNLIGDMSVVKMSSFFYQNAIKGSTDRGWTFYPFMKFCTDYMIDGKLYDVQNLLKERIWITNDQVPIDWAIYGRQMDPKEDVANGWVDLSRMSSNIEQRDMPISCNTTRFNVLIRTTGVCDNDKKTLKEKKNNVVSHIFDFTEWMKDLSSFCSATTCEPSRHQHKQLTDMEFSELCARNSICRLLLPMSIELTSPPTVLEDGSGFVAEVEQETMSSHGAMERAHHMMNVLRAMICLRMNFDEDKKRGLFHTLKMGKCLVEHLIIQDLDWFNYSTGRGRTTGGGGDDDGGDKSRVISDLLKVNSTSMFEFARCLVEVIDKMTERSFIKSTDFSYKGKDVGNKNVEFFWLLMRYFTVGHIFCDSNYVRLPALDGKDDPSFFMYRQDFYSSFFSSMPRHVLDEQGGAGLFAGYSSQEFFEGALYSWVDSALYGDNLPSENGPYGAFDSGLMQKCGEILRNMLQTESEFTKYHLLFRQLVYRVRGNIEDPIRDLHFATHGGLMPMWNSDTKTSWAALCSMHNPDDKAWKNERKTPMFYSQDMKPLAKSMSRFYRALENVRKEYLDCDTDSQQILADSSKWMVDVPSMDPEILVICDSSSSEPTKEPNNDSGDIETRKSLLKGCIQSHKLDINEEKHFKNLLGQYKIHFNGFVPTHAQYGLPKDYNQYRRWNFNEENWTTARDEYPQQLLLNYWQLMRRGFIFPDYVTADKDHWDSGEDDRFYHSDSKSEKATTECGDLLLRCKETRLYFPKSPNWKICSEKVLGITSNILDISKSFQTDYSINYRQLEFLSVASPGQFAVFITELKHQSNVFQNSLAEYTIHGLYDGDFITAIDSTVQSQQCPDNKFSDGGVMNLYQVVLTDKKTWRDTSKCDFIQEELLSTVPVLSVPPFHSVMSPCPSSQDYFFNCTSVVQKSLVCAHEDFQYLGTTALLELLKFLARVEAVGLLDKLPCNFMHFICNDHTGGTQKNGNLYSSPISRPEFVVGTETRLIYNGCMASVVQFVMGTPSIKDWTDSLNRLLSEKSIVNESYSKKPLTVQQGIMHMICQLLSAADITTPITYDSEWKSVVQLSMDRTVHCLSPPELEFLQYFHNCCAPNIHTMYSNMTFQNLVQTCNLSLFRLPLSCRRSIHRLGWGAIDIILGKLISSTDQSLPSYESMVAIRNECRSNETYSESQKNWLHHFAFHPDMNSLVDIERARVAAVHANTGYSKKLLQNELSVRNNIQVEPNSNTISLCSRGFDDRCHKEEIRKICLDFLQENSKILERFSTEELDDRIQFICNSANTKLSRDKLNRTLEKNISADFSTEDYWWREFLFRKKRYNLLEMALAFMNQRPYSISGLPIFFTSLSLQLGMMNDCHIAAGTSQFFTNALRVQKKHLLDSTLTDLPRGTGVSDVVQTTLTTIVNPITTPSVLVDLYNVLQESKTKLSDATKRMIQCFEDSVVFNSEGLADSIVDRHKRLLLGCHEFKKYSARYETVTGDGRSRWPLCRPWVFFQKDKSKKMEIMTKVDGVGKTGNQLRVNPTVEYINWVFSKSVLSYSLNFKPTFTVHPASLMVYLYPAECATFSSQIDKNNRRPDGGVDISRLTRIVKDYWMSCKTSMASGASPILPPLDSLADLMTVFPKATDEDNWACDQFYAEISNHEQSRLELQHLQDCVLAAHRKNASHNMHMISFFEMIGRSLPPHLLHNMMFDVYNVSEYQKQESSPVTSDDNDPTASSEEYQQCEKLLRGLPFLVGNYVHPIVLPSVWYFIPNKFFGTCVLNEFTSDVSRSEFPIAAPYFSCKESSFEGISMTTKTLSADYRPTRNGRYLKKMVDLYHSDKELTHKLFHYIWCYDEVRNDDLEITYRPFKLTTHKIFIDWLAESPTAAELESSLMHTLGLSTFNRDKKVSVEICPTSTKTVCAMINRLHHWSNLIGSDNLVKEEITQSRAYSVFSGCGPVLYLRDMLVGILMMNFNDKLGRLDIPGEEHLAKPGDTENTSYSPDNLLFVEQHNFSKYGWSNCGWNINDKTVDYLETMKYCYCTNSKKDHQHASEQKNNGGLYDSDNDGEDDDDDNDDSDIDMYEDDGGSSSSSGGGSKQKQKDKTCKKKAERVVTMVTCNLCESLSASGAAHYQLKPNFGSLPDALLESPTIIFNYSKIKHLYFQHLDTCMRELCSRNTCLRV